MTGIARRAASGTSGAVSPAFRELAGSLPALATCASSQHCHTASLLILAVFLDHLNKRVLET